MTIHRGILASAVFLLSFFIYLPFDLPAVGNASDNYWYVPTSVSLIHERNIELSEYEELIQKRSGYGIIRYKSKPYNLFPFGTSFVTLPLVATGEILFHNSNEVARFFEIAALSAKILAALSVAFLFLTVLRLTNQIAVAAVLTIIFAFATSHFSIHAGGLWSHNTALLLITISLYILAGEKQISLAALPLGLAFIARPTMAAPIVLISAYVFWFHRPQFLRYALFGSAVAVLFMLFSYHVFGRLLPPYYGAGRLDFRHFWEALLGNLISPNRGLFVFTPVFLGSIYGMYWSWKSKTKDALFFRLLTLMVIVHWILISTFSHWWAGATIGPRFFCDNLSVLTLLLIPAAIHFRRGALLYAASAILLAWSLFAQIHAVTSGQVYRWNFTPVRLSADPSRIWDWKDLQILRTAIPESSVKNLPYSFKIFRDARLTARVMKADVPEIADAEVRIDHKKYKAVLLNELLARYKVQGESVIISGGNEETTLKWEEIQDVYIYFSQGRVARIFCNCAKEFPPFTESITVTGP